MFKASPGFRMFSLRTVDLAAADHSCVFAGMVCWRNSPLLLADPLAWARLSPSGWGQLVQEEVETGDRTNFPPYLIIPILNTVRDLCRLVSLNPEEACQQIIISNHVQPSRQSSLLGGSSWNILGRCCQEGCAEDTWQNWVMWRRLQHQLEKKIHPKIHLHWFDHLFCVLKCCSWVFGVFNTHSMCNQFLHYLKTVKTLLRHQVRSLSWSFSISTIK